MSNIRLAFCVFVVSGTLIVPSVASAAALHAPALDSPAAGATVESAPALTWSAVRGAARYDYQLANDEGFGSVVLGSGTGTGSASTRNTAATLSSTVPDGPYYWRVRAIDRKDRAGRWSKARRYTQAWTTAPVLRGPDASAPITWPTTALVLKWSVVPHATKYIVTIANDPSLSSALLGSAASPVTVAGTSFAFTGTLAPGSYYWAITPLDEAGHKGQRSAVGSFTWSWLSTTTAAVVDANAVPSVYDPLFSWTAVPGAASYDVEVNSSHDWAPGSKICCTDRTVGTSLAPIKALTNNVYYWRVRAIDASGNAGGWNEGPSFQKDFDPAVPSIPNLRIRDNSGELGLHPASATPIIAWDPVPGASSYTVQIARLNGVCDWSGQRWTTFNPSPNWTWIDNTAATAWTFLSGRHNLLSDGPVPAAIPLLAEESPALEPGVQYCVRVRARSDRESKSDNPNADDGFISDWTQINGLGQASFTYQDPVAPPGVTPAPLASAVATYVAPVTGSDSAHPPVLDRLPVFTWNAIPGAAGYWVVVARDASFTTIIDYAFTRRTNYAPGSSVLGITDVVTYRDEATHLYWAVIPAANPDGTGASTVPSQNAPQLFDKHSAPPVLIEPAEGADVATQPSFHWSSSEGARKFELQVSRDPTFGTPIDDITTSSTAYTSSTTYPADTKLYWRVGAIDERGIHLDWSPAGTFVRRLPVSAPAPGNPVGGSDIPVLSWLPVPGAISYDIHVDYVDGRTKDITVLSPAFTPTEFYGNGVWRWKVRPNFATTGVQTVSGGYFAPQQYVREVGRTPNVRGSITSSRVLLTWDPDPSAKSYAIEISPSTGFGESVDRVSTKTTSFAPNLTGSPYDDGGRLYWRVASIVEGNAGPFTSGSFVLPKAIRATVAGYLIVGTKGTIGIEVRDARGRPVRGAKVRVTGSGLRSRSRRSSKAGIARFSLKPKHRGLLTFTVTRRGYRDAVATSTVS